MNMMNHPIAIRQDSQSGLRSDVKAELARHRFDPRIYALVMLLGAVLAAYGGVLIMDVGGATVSGQPVSFGAPADLLSVCGLSVCILVACLCLLEAGRGLRKL